MAENNIRQQAYIPTQAVAEITEEIDQKLTINSHIDVIQSVINTP